MAVAIDTIQKLYDEANVAHVEATKLIDRGTKGETLTTEERARIDTLLDSVENLTTQARQLERANAQEKEFAGTSNGRDFFHQNEGDDAETERRGSKKSTAPVTIKWQGMDLTEDEAREILSYANFKAFMPVDAASQTAYIAYKQAMRQYIRKGPKGMTDEARKALSVGEGPEGGYWVQDTFLTGMLELAAGTWAMRRLGNVLPMLPVGSIISVAEANPMSDAEWTAELRTGTADTVKPFAQVRLQPHPLSKIVLVSNTLFRAPTFNAEAYVRNQMAQRFGSAEENAFINGTGVGQPLGLLTDPDVPTMSTAGADLTGDDVINFCYALGSSYQANARILANKSFVRKVRLLKLSDGQYIWQPGLQMGSPAQIVDVPYEVSDWYPSAVNASTDAWTAGAPIATIGDFSY
jgi:HK97 family phage major capsid protein